MPVLLSRLARALYIRVSSLSWSVVLVVALLHFGVSWAGLAVFDGGEVSRSKIFWYFYVTTATTVGYGDFSPTTEIGRLVTALWIMPGGIALFTTIIAKAIQAFTDKWRRKVRGLGSYENLAGHIVILGWHGARTRWMVDHIRGDTSDVQTEIVLCSAQEMENPLPEHVKFVRDASLNSPDILRRAGIAHAAIVIALGHDDNETLAAALGAGAANPDAHLVAYFQQKSFAELLKAHVPQAECNVSLTIEMMVRSAQDPGSSRVQSQLLSTLKGPTQFSLRVPEAVGPMLYGALFATFKDRHDATLFGVAVSTVGDDLILNAPKDHPVRPGSLLYFMAARRINSGDIDWGTMVATGAG
ncbi:MAG: ion channel [Hyphomicrobium sp.]